MVSIIKSIALQGLNGYLVEVQTDISAGIPKFEIVGLPDKSVREAAERIKSAIKNTGFNILSRKILINLAPASKKKGGTGFDLPMAIGVLLCMGSIKRTEIIKNTAFLGELSLDGDVHKINGILPMCIEAKKLGIKNIVVPKANLNEAKIVEGIKIIAAQNLEDVVNFLNFGILKKFDIVEEIEKVDEEDMDFSEVKGQAVAKRALEIAIAGGHNCLLIGSPGTGKTMLAKRVKTIMPNLTYEESLEITKIYSVSGELKEGQGLVTKRPFRNPHYTTSLTSIIGGGQLPKPGEITLAHFGILFLDEFAELSRRVIEALRCPLEDKKVIISRVNQKIEYPCDFMLIASMNPCPCGYYGSEIKKCICTQKNIDRYLSKVSGPIMDRIDLQIEVNKINYKNISSTVKEETSEQIKKRVNKAREIQKNRYFGTGIYSNSNLDNKLIEKYCTIEKNAEILMEKAFDNLKLSARSYNKILKVARTIADLDGKERIEVKHLAEAIQYRTLDKKYIR